MNAFRYCCSIAQKMTEYIYGYFHKGSKVFVLHQVSDDKNSWKDEDCAISLEGFREFLCKLIEKGKKFGSIEELKFNSNESKVYLTFDDIYNDAIENAFPILIKQKIPFCIFVSTNLIDKNKYITYEQLKYLSEEPLCTIGFHTKSHSMMRYLATDEVENEISAKQLEEKIKTEIKYFAFPYGSYYAVSKNNVKKVNKSGYGLVFSTLRMEIDDETKKKFSGFLPRININEKNYRKYIKNE